MTEPLNYDDCVRLMKAGLRQDFHQRAYPHPGQEALPHKTWSKDACFSPNTDELIEALGEGLGSQVSIELYRGISATAVPRQWDVRIGFPMPGREGVHGRGKTPLKAVCELFIALSEHKKEEE